MKILLDECVPSRLRRLLGNHEVKTVTECGRAGIKSGELLKKATESFDVFLTVDRNLSFQQSLSFIPLPIVIIHSPSNKIEDLEKFVPQIVLLLQQKPTAKINHLGA